MQVTSAVRIFNQQNLIELSKYRVNAIGKLVKGIAEELKAPLLSIGASLEATKILVENIKAQAGDEAYNKMNDAFVNGKLQMERINKICKTIINQVEDDSKNVGITIEDIIDTLKLMVTNELKLSGVVFNEDIAVKKDSYIYGKVDDVIFIVCELIHKILEVSSAKDTITFGLRESDTAWYISLTSDKIKFIEKTKVFLIKSIISRMEDIEFEEISDQYVIEMKKIGVTK